MKQFKECARLHSLNEQVFAHVFLFGFLFIIATIIWGASFSDGTSPLSILTFLGAFGIAILALISSNRITYLDDTKSTLEIQWIFAYRFCIRRRAIPLKDVIQLTLLTITDFEGDKTYRLNIEVFAKDRGLLKHTSDKIAIVFSHSLDPILKSGEQLGKLFRKKLVRTSS